MQERIRNPQNNNSANELSKETVNLVKAFYEDDVNSRVLPGKKDVLSSRDESNNKVKTRKQLLLDDIDNLYSKFIYSYPNHKIGRSKFFSLRPNWVLPVQAQSQEVCKCIYHENIDLVCTALANFSRSKQIQIDLKSFQLQTILSKLLSVISLIKTVFGEIVTIVQQTTFTNYLSHFKHFTMTRSSFISGKGFC